MYPIPDPNNPSVVFDERVKDGILEKVRIETTELVNSDNTSTSNNGWIEVRTVTKTTITTTRVLTQFTI